MAELKAVIALLLKSCRTVVADLFSARVSLHKKRAAGAKCAEEDRKRRMNQANPSSKKAKKEGFNIFDFEPSGGHDHYTARSFGAAELGKSVVQDEINVSCPFVMRCDLFSISDAPSVDALPCVRAHWSGTRNMAILSMLGLQKHLAKKFPTQVPVHSRFMYSWLRDAVAADLQELLDFLMMVQSFGGLQWGPAKRFGCHPRRSYSNRQWGSAIVSECVAASSATGMGRSRPCLHMSMSLTPRGARTQPRTRGSSSSGRAWAQSESWPGGHMSGAALAQRCLSCSSRAQH